MNKPIKKKQSWPLGVDKGIATLMTSQGGALLMLGHVVGNYFYTPDVGCDKWEIWNICDVTPKALKDSKS